MNAVVKAPPQAEYFRCAALNATMSRAQCAENWRLRGHEDGYATCRACPEIVQQAVQRGLAELITVDEVYAGVRPQAVGETMQIVPGDLRRSVSPVESFKRRRKELLPARKVAVLKALAGRPWITGFEVGRIIGLSTQSAWIPLRKLADEGLIVTWRQPGSSSKAGSRIHYALPEDADTAPVPDKMRTVRNAVLSRLVECPGASSGQLAVDVGTHIGHVRRVLNRMHGEGLVTKTGSDRLGRKWWVVENTEVGA